MKKILMFSIILGVMLMSVGLVFATRPDTMPDKARNSFALPENAVEVSPGKFYLGKAMDKGRVVEGYAFVHYKKGYGRVCDNDGVCEPGENPSCVDCKKDTNGEEESTCYAFLGAKWKELPVDYVIDPDNSYGLTENFVTSAISAGAEEWNAHTSAELFGTYSIDYSSSWDSKVPDGRNELLFGNYPQDGVIAVTIIWGYFRGKPSNRRITEFDILFDTDFKWGDGESTLSLMDLQNIATHEIGHGLGLGDLYNTECIEQTMYGYSTEGDIQKRDLAYGDIAGITSLYG